jgi:hypothetical protein
MKKHTVVHSENVQKCDECGKLCVNARGLAMHMDRVHRASPGSGAVTSEEKPRQEDSAMLGDVKDELEPEWPSMSKNSLKILRSAVNDEVLSTRRISPSNSKTSPVDRPSKRTPWSKRTRTPYHFYSCSIRPQVARELNLPETSNVVRNEVRRRWNGLGSAEKEVFQRMSEKDAERVKDADKENNPAEGNLNLLKETIQEAGTIVKCGDDMVIKLKIEDLGDLVIPLEEEIQEAGTIVNCVDDLVIELKMENLEDLVVHNVEEEKKAEDTVNISLEEVKGLSLLANILVEGDSTKKTID